MPKSKNIQRTQGTSKANVSLHDDGLAIPIEWLDAESSGYTDLLPANWFSKPVSRKGRLHWCVGPRGGTYPAWCDVSFTDEAVELDYENHREENQQHGILPGVARFVFTDLTSRRIAKAYWKDPDGRFSRIPIRTGPMRSLRNELSAEEDIPAGNVAPNQKTAQKTFFVRDSAVRAAVLKRAGGKCEHCSESGFLKLDGGRYLESHHVLALAAKGPDTMGNVVALCANHHREAHFGAKAASLNAALLATARQRQANGAVS